MQALSVLTCYCAINELNLSAQLSKFAVFQNDYATYKDLSRKEKREQETCMKCHQLHQHLPQQKQRYMLLWYTLTPIQQRTIDSPANFFCFLFINAATMYKPATNCNQDNFNLLQCLL